MEKNKQYRNVLKLIDTENPKYLNFKGTYFHIHRKYLIQPPYIQDV